MTPTRAVVAVILVTGALGAAYYAYTLYSIANTSYSSEGGNGMDARLMSPLTTEQEVGFGELLGMEMIARYGVSKDEQAKMRVRETGVRLVKPLGGIAYRYAFIVLADPNAVNAYALPGGAIFVTEGLLRLLKTDDEVAAVLSHEIGHVHHSHAVKYVRDHPATRDWMRTAVARQADYGPAEMQRILDVLLGMQYDDYQELSADSGAAGLMAKAGYDARAMLAVSDTLARAKPQDLLATHPHHGKRAEQIRSEIERLSPADKTEKPKP